MARNQNSADSEKIAAEKITPTMTVRRKMINEKFGDVIDRGESSIRRGGVDSHLPEGVVGVLVDGDRFLLIRRAEGIAAGGWWTPPSGRIEPGESQQQALIREMREELGVNVLPIALVWTCPSYDGTWVLFWWLCQITDGSITPDHSEVAEARWCTVREMRDLSPTFPDDLRFFSEILPAIPTGRLGRRGGHR